VLSARWESFADVIDDTVTGYGYDFGSTEALVALLKEAAKDPTVINKLKANCLKKAQDYTPDKEIAILLNKEGKVHI
jgi:glycosyltransferase involved in cell wall biosynthesis